MNYMLPNVKSNLELFPKKLLIKVYSLLIDGAISNLPIKIPNYWFILDKLGFLAQLRLFKKIDRKA